MYLNTRNVSTITKAIKKQKSIKVEKASIDGYLMLYTFFYQSFMKNRNLESSDNWATPKEFYSKLNSEFNFDFDPCPLNLNEITPENDGLSIDWKQSNYINPPYSRELKEAFVKKAIQESKKGKLCVMLLPVSTSTKLFHQFVKPNAKEIRFIEGRIKFLGINTKGEFVSNKAPMHDSMIVIFDGRCN